VLVSGPAAVTTTRALAVVLALAAAACMVVAIAGMVTHRQSERTGWLVRVAALVCFVAAVVLGSTAR
jgi:uncharacterized membrane protein HdeD (DUF308 family)